MLLPLAVAYALVGRVKPLVRALLIYAAVGMMAGLAVTFSRGGWVAAAVGLLTLLLVLSCHRNHRLPALGLLILFVAGGTVFVTKYLATDIQATLSAINSPETFVQRRLGRPAGHVGCRHANVAGSFLVGCRAGALRLSFPGVSARKHANASRPRPQ